MYNLIRILQFAKPSPRFIQALYLPLYLDLLLPYICSSRCRYEGNITSEWGALSGVEETDRFWWGAAKGVYVGAGKRCFWRHSIRKPEDLPRQARDKQRESSKQRRFCRALGDGSGLEAVCGRRPAAAVVGQGRRAEGRVASAHRMVPYAAHKRRGGGSRTQQQRDAWPLRRAAAAACGCGRPPVCPGEWARYVGRDAHQQRRFAIADSVRECETLLWFLKPFFAKHRVLPRQARDKHSNI